MAKRKKPKLKELQIRIAVPATAPRSKEYDKLALATANELSSTPVKKFKFLGKTISPFSTNVEELVYAAWGTPIKDSNAATG